MDSIWEEETWQQHFSPWHLQQKHLHSATAVWEEWTTWQASATGFISAQSGPDCLCRHPWPLYRMTHGWQTKLRGLRAACRDDSLAFRARMCDRKLIPYGRPCGGETQFKCCCLETKEIALDKKKHLYQQVHTFMSLCLILSYPLISDICVVHFPIGKKSYLVVIWLKTWLKYVLALKKNPFPFSVETIDFTAIQK